mgnify:CR=1 FL=1
MKLKQFKSPQDDSSTSLDMSEARASLLSGDVVELTNASSVDSTTIKLSWDVSQKHENLNLAQKLIALRFLSLENR